MTLIHKQLEIRFAGFTAKVYQHKYAALLSMLILTFVLASQTSKLTFDTRDESFFHEDDPALIAYNRFRDTFGQDDMFIIALKPEAGLTLPFFAALYQIHSDLEAAVPYIDEISSLVNGRIVRADGDTLVVEDLMQAPARSQPELDRIMALIDRYPLWASWLQPECP